MASDAPSLSEAKAPPVPMTPEEQVLFARFLRERLPKPEGAEWHAIHTFTDYSRRVLKRPDLTFWRDLSAEDGRRVMQAAAREYPPSRPA